MGTGGNISARVVGQKAFAITRSNYDYAKMTLEDICVLGYDMSRIEGEFKPSVESSMHGAISTTHSANTTPPASNSNSPPAGHKKQPNHENHHELDA